MVRLAKWILTVCVVTACTTKDAYKNWEVKGGTPDGLQYSALNQINIDNVKNLKLAWTYASGDADTVDNRSQIQCNPIIIDGVLYGTSPALKPFAIDASTGREIWKFSPPDKNSGLGVNRGVTYWNDGTSKRILFSFGEYLYSLDAKTGEPDKNFGSEGRVSLKEGLGKRASKLMVLSNTPGVIYKNLIIMGSRVHEGPMAAPGHIRAFNVITGKLEWVFNTIPQPGEFGYDTWPEDAWQRVGGANAWCGMTVDHKRGLVFAATGSASFDFYGGNRKGQNLFANCVLALDATTGKRKWHYQTTHHDLWDRDLPTAPVLGSFDLKGKKIETVIQVTKQGVTFVFDRDSGEPVFPIEERPTPKSELDGEEAWSTQPIPTKPVPFSRQYFAEDRINRLTPETEKYVSDYIKNLRFGKEYIPPSVEGTVIFPGFDGGAEWGGPSFDPSNGMLYVNANEMPWNLKMVDVRLDEKTSRGLGSYRLNCTVCHGFDKKGNQQAPSLENVNKKYNENTLTAFLEKGQRAMPSFGHLPIEERNAIARYLLSLDEKISQAEKGSFERSPDIFFSNTGYNRMLTPEGYPMVSPPWGTLTALSLPTGEIAWQVPLGEFKELKEKGIPPTGTENYGGPVSTAGGLVFIAASRDEKFRAFDKATGKILWETDLPAGGYATPAVFEINGKQIVVIACGGGKMGTRSGDKYVAFALP